MSQLNLFKRRVGFGSRLGCGPFGTVRIRLVSSVESGRIGLARVSLFDVLGRIFWIESGFVSKIMVRTRPVNYCGSKIMIRTRLLHCSGQVIESDGS